MLKTEFKRNGNFVSYLESFSIVQNKKHDKEKN